MKFEPLYCSISSQHTYQPVIYSRGSTKGAVKGAITGANIGSRFGPIGIVAGTAIGGVLGLTLIHK